MKTFRVILSLVVLVVIFTEFVKVSLPFMDTLDRSCAQGLATGCAIILAHIFGASIVLYHGIAKDFFDDE